MILAIVVLFLSLFGLMMMLLIRGKLGYRINIKADIRNPSRKPYKRLAFFDKKEKVVKFYKGVLYPTPTKVQSYFDPDAFSKNKVIDGYIGVSGKEDDDNFVPVGGTLMSGAMANSLSQKLSDSIVNTLLSLKVKTKDTAGVEIEKSIDFGKEANDAITKAFDKAFVMNTFGVIEVKDANLILQHQKIQVADLHSRTNEFRTKHLSWFTQNQVLIGFIMMCFVITICGVIFWQETATLIKSQAAQPSWINGLINALNHTKTVALPGNGNVTVT